MKTLLLLALVGLAIGFPTAALAQEKEGATPFLYRAIPASPQIAQQLEATNAQFDEAINKHDAVAAAALLLICRSGLVPMQTAQGDRRC